MQPIQTSLPCSSTSAPIEVEQTEASILSAMSGDLWVCHKREADELGGYIYTFSMKDEFRGKEDTKVLARYQLIVQRYPALVPTEVSINFLNPDKSEETLMKEHIQDAYFLKYTQEKRVEQFFDGTRSAVLDVIREEYLTDYKGVLRHRKILNELGYLITEVDGKVLLNVPDKDALLARWEKLRERFPRLKPLIIESSSGIVSHKEFIAAFLEGRLILSPDGEFMHDHFYHIIPAICLALEFEIGEARRDALRAMTVNVLSVIKEYKAQIRDKPWDSRMDCTMMTVALSIFIDSMTTISNVDNLEEEDPDMLEFSLFLNELPTDDNWKHYFYKNLSEIISRRVNEGVDVIRSLVKSHIDSISDTWGVMNNKGEGFFTASQTSSTEFS